jgi:hypothetical protein
MRFPFRFAHLQAIAAAAAAGFALVRTAAFFGAASVSVPACTNSDAGGITPITGIIVLADGVAEGRGCGTGADQIYKYTSVVTSAPDAGIAAGFVAGGTSDCFADQTFTNLCASSTGSTPFFIDVYAYSQAAWTASLGDNASVYLPATSSSLDPLAPPQSGTVCDDASTAPDLGILGTDLSRHATIIFHCTATQQTNVPVLAACVQTFPSLAPGPDDAGGAPPVDSGPVDSGPLDSGTDAADGGAK